MILSCPRLYPWRKRMEGGGYWGGRSSFPGQWCMAAGNRAWPRPACTQACVHRKLAVCLIHLNAGEDMFGALYSTCIFIFLLCLFLPLTLIQFLLRAFITFCHCKHRIFLCPLSWPVIRVEGWWSLPPSWNTLFLWLSWRSTFLVLQDFPFLLALLNVRSP